MSSSPSLLGVFSCCSVDSIYGDIEVMNRLHRANRLVQAHGRGILRVCLYEDDIGAALSGESLQPVDEARGDSPSPVTFQYCQVIDVHFLSLLLELLQDIRCKTTYNLFSIERRECYEMALAE